MNHRIRVDTYPPKPHLRHETALWANGALWVAGIDEAGRGALAGPVSAAAVVLPHMTKVGLGLDGVRDSKKMTPIQRESWSSIIRETAVTYGVGLATAQEIDTIGIVPATQLAASRAIDMLSICPDFLLVDYIVLPSVAIPQIPLVKGDLRSLSIASASVIAKITRDAILIEMDALYPGYGLSRHKGYGTAAHREAIRTLGPSPIHRMSFAPICS